MLSNDDFSSVEINEMKNKNPQFEEYDKIFRKIKEALTIEIQSTKQKLFEKLNELNEKTEHQFDRLYKSCDRQVCKFYDLKYKNKITKNKSDTNEDEQIISIEEKKNLKRKKEKEKKNDVQIKSPPNSPPPPQNHNENSENEYSDEVIFGFLEGSEEESEFVD